MSNKTLLFCITILTLLSCKKDGNLNEIILSKEILNFNFPDKVYVNHSIDGNLKYNLNIDSISDNEIEDRFIFLHVTVGNEVETVDEVKKLDYKTFIDTTRSGTFNFNATFKELGVNLLSGVIEDQIILNTVDKEGNVRLITRETSFSKRVQVQKEESKKGLALFSNNR